VSTIGQRFRAAAGVLLGLVASALVLLAFENNRATAVSMGPQLSDCDGAIGELVIHYVGGAHEIVGAVYDDFLRQLPADVTVHVVCPDRSGFDELIDHVGTTRCILSPVISGHPITTWSRDRWLAIAPSPGRSATIVMSPRGEMGADIWPERAGDAEVGDGLASALGPQRVISIRSELYFDGGDFVADDQTVFVTPNVLVRNLQHTVETREQLLARLSMAAQRDVVLLRDAPDHHAGMYMMPVGERTVLVGDPRMAMELLAADNENTGGLCPPQGPDFRPETIARFDAVARQCRDVGYRVVRIPVAPGRDGRTYITYLNAILDEREGRRTVYMPVFDGAGALNRVAQDIWVRLGYNVRRVNCSACYEHFGSLRCLVNVLRRGASGPTLIGGASPRRIPPRT
ncbi:MAG: hypothetical protein QF805_23155, partial [Pirellulaceae bacterium]|nr:hypothetical protein [Pirellulaceae bacterium]